MTTDPELGVLVTKHKIDVEDDERKFSHSYKWESCCLRTDKRALSFFTQVAFSASIVAFTVGMMAAHPEDCASFSRYSPLLTLVVGVWLPSPQLRDS